MKSRITHALLISLCLGARAFATGLSVPTNGVYLAVGGWRGGSGGVTNEPFSAGDGLVFLTFCNTGQVELVYPLDLAYGVKVKMIAPDGSQVQKTRLGRTLGSRFDQLRDYRDTRTGIIPAWGSYEDNKSLGGGRLLPTPKALFLMKKPGVYTMEIEMQMFRVIKGTNSWSRELFRFSPIRIKVEKEPEE
jgi:hypothetical protein